MKEKIIHGLLLVATLLFWIISGRVTEHLWENVAPWIWALSIILIYHALLSAVKLNREIDTEQRDGFIERESPIFSASGRRATWPVQPEPIPQYHLKIICLALLFCGPALLASYITLKRSKPGDKADLDGPTPYLAIKLGKIGQADHRLNVNVSCVNVGQSVIRRADCSAKLIIHDGGRSTLNSDVENRYFDEFMNEYKDRKAHICSGSINVTEYCWFSLAGPPIAAVGKDLIKDRKVVLIIGRALFASDSGKPYATEICYIGNTPAPGRETTWSKCDVHIVDGVPMPNW